MTNNSTERNFWSNMVTAVKTTSDLAYVQTWLDGTRDRIFIPSELPAVVFRPVKVKDEIKEIGKNSRANSGITFHIIGITRTTDVDNSIVGNSSNTGILKLDEDLKNAIENHLITTGRNWDIQTIDFQIPESIQAGTTQIEVLATVIEVTIDDAYFFTIGLR